MNIEKNKMVELSLSMVATTEKADPVVEVKINLDIDEIKKSIETAKNLGNNETAAKKIENTEWKTIRGEWGDDFDGKENVINGAELVLSSTGDLRVISSDNGSEIISEPINIESLLGVVAGKVFYIDRVEFAPVRCRYSIAAKTEEEAIEKMEKISDGEMNSAESEDIMRSRYIIAFDTVSQILPKEDDKFQWTINGKDISE